MSDKKKRELNPKTKRIIGIIAAVIAVVALAVCAYFYNSSKQDFDSYTKNGIAMGTVITVKTYGDTTAPKAEAIMSVINQLDKTISWREKDSAVARVNNGENVRLNELSQIVARCKDVAENSDGAFDPTIGNVSTLWDFGGDNERLPTDSEIQNALKTVDYTKMKFDGAVSVDKGQKIDLGAVGKGYACDMVKTYLESTDIEGAVVSVGGSILAYGHRNKAGDKWRIAVKHPRNEQGILGTISLDEGFVSTSGDYEKYFEKDGKRYHHILDARTGYPAESDLISVTIITDNGLLSDALSTACFILGSEKGKALAEKYNASAIFVNKEEKIEVVGDVDFEVNK